MRNIFFLLIFLVAPFSAYSQEEKPKNFPVAGEFSTLTSSLEYSTKNIAMIGPDDQKTLKSLKEIDDDLGQGLDLYKRKKYEQAYPILSELAQWGIKDSQAILGTMYVKGEHVDQSIEQGLAWLGVASEKGSSKVAKSMFDYVYEQLNDDQKKHIDTKVDHYISMYGMKVQNISCKRKAESGSRIRKKICSKTPGSKSPLYALGS